MLTFFKENKVFGDDIDTLLSNSSVIEKIKIIFKFGFIIKSPEFPSPKFK